MVFNVTVLQILQEAKVDLFEIIKNNQQYILNCFTRMIEQCEDAKKEVDPRNVPMVQNIKNEWFQLREEYIGNMVYEYKRQLNAWKPWHIITNINKCHFTADEIMEHMLSEQRFKLPWPDYGTYYQKLLQIQSDVIKQFPIERYNKRCKQKFTK